MRLGKYVLSERQTILLRSKEDDLFWLANVYLSYRRGFNWECSMPAAETNLLGIILSHSIRIAKVA